MEGRELSDRHTPSEKQNTHTHSLRAEMKGAVLILPMAEIDGLILE